jgi:hypothetical protein
MTQLNVIFLDISDDAATEVSFTELQDRGASVKIIKPPFLGLIDAIMPLVLSVDWGSVNQSIATGILSNWLWSELQRLKTRGEDKTRIVIDIQNSDGSTRRCELATSQNLASSDVSDIVNSFMTGAI